MKDDAHMPKSNGRPCLFCAPYTGWWKVGAFLLLAAAGAAGMRAWASAESPETAPAPSAAGLTASAGEVADPALVTLFYRADWCALCKIMEPDLALAKAETYERPVLFLDLDLTDQATTRGAEASVAAIGLMDTYRENAFGTGYAIVVDPATGDVVARLAPGMSGEEMAQAIREAL